HFERVRAGLRDEGIPAVLNHRLVRGFDYYTRTVFEVWPPTVGAQSSIGGGGRYDGLAEQIGGRHTPGVGFGTGIERLILNLHQQGVELPPAPQAEVYGAPLNQAAHEATLGFARALRARGVPTMLGVGQRSVRARLRNADAAGVRWTALFGDDEVQNGTVSLRDMSITSPETLGVSAAVDRIVASTAERPL